MKITILFFGITTDLVNENSIQFTIERDTTVKYLKGLLAENYPKLKNIDDFAIAVNEEYANDEVLLKENDVVAVIPPVSGG
jgi:molybdopterin converting factor subunit 1